MAKEKLLGLIEKLNETPSIASLSVLTFLGEISEHAKEQQKETTMSDYVAQRVYEVFARGFPQKAYALAETERRDFIKTHYKQTA